MSDYNTMTAQQCADWLAERDGYGPKCGQYGEYRYVVNCDGHAVESLDPYPMTLDGAAAALREPWYLVRVSHYGVRWSCHIERMNPACERLIVDAPDRMTAEYRAAVAARMEDDK